MVTYLVIYLCIYEHPEEHLYGTACHHLLAHLHEHLYSVTARHSAMHMSDGMVLRAVRGGSEPAVKVFEPPRWGFGAFAPKPRRSAHSAPGLRRLRAEDPALSLFCARSSAPPRRRPGAQPILRRVFYGKYPKYIIYINI